jgi:hypothetical protein
MSDTNDPSPRPAKVTSPLARRGFLLAAAAVVVAGTLRFSERSQSDDIPADEIERRKAALKTVGLLKVDLVGPEELSEAYKSLSLSAPDMERLQAAVQAGNIRLFWIAVFDSDAEDGDCIAIESLGLSQTVRLTKKPQRIALPLPPSGEVRLTGTDEGLGGGITVGVIAQNGRTVVFPPIPVGQSGLILVTGG